MRAAPHTAETDRPYIVHSSSSPKRRRWLLFAAIGLLVLLAIAAVLFAKHWPFTREAVVRDLEEGTGAQAEFKSFRQTYFPPGAVAEGVILRRDRQMPPLASVERLTIRATYAGMLRHHVALLKADGAHIALRSGESLRGSRNSGNSQTVIGQLQADEAVVDVFHAGAPRPTRFAIHQLRLTNLGNHEAIGFQVALTIPKPTGEAQVSGRLGPWNSGDPQQTPVSGSYTFRHADLGTVKGVGGVLSSEGKFKGPVSAIQVDGTTEMPDFELKNVAHRERLNTRFHAVVNATNGDVLVPTVNARLGETAVAATGDIASLIQQEGQHGKTVSADFIVNEGRIQDVLWLFMKSPQPPLAGVTSFRAHATVPPGHERFLRKLHLVGDFGIDQARFTKPATEDKVSQLSERARGDATPPADPANVLSDVKGHVDVFGGVAHLTDLSFSVPGAIAHVHGTYDLITKKINLQGTVQTSVKLSQTTTGTKSFLMKVIGRFKNNNHPGSPIPVSVVGTFPNPQYQIHPLQ